jgi:signal transduction histidine kinase
MSGAERWLTIHDELLRGVAHAISNRLATISAMAGVLDASVAPDPRFLEGMCSDASRLEGLLELLRQLPRRTAAEREPLLITDVLHAARRLVSEHSAMHGREVVVTSNGDVMPVRAEPGAVVHAIAVALLAAARHATHRVEVQLATIDDVVKLDVRGDGGVTTDGDATALLVQDAGAMAWLVAQSHGSAQPLADGCALTLPTLSASRRRG